MPAPINPEELGYEDIPYLRECIIDMRLTEPYRRECESRIKVLEAQHEAANLKFEVAKQKKLLVSFVDTRSKPAGSIDRRSVQHAVADATSDKKGFAGLSLAGVLAVYEWANNHPEVLQHFPEIPTIIWAALIFFGAAVWCVKLAENLSRKWFQEHKEH